MKIVLFITMFGFCFSVASEDSHETRESVLNEYKIEYCEDPRFLFCADIEEETCIAAIDNAGNVCESKYSRSENYRETPSELFIFKLCVMGELPLQEDLVNKASKFCLNLPATKKNEDAGNGDTDTQNDAHPF